MIQGNKLYADLQTPEGRKKMGELLIEKYPDDNVGRAAFVNYHIEQGYITVQQGIELLKLKPRPHTYDHL